jgi:coproporphyrinogen III oxidase-like Fe-S oxidoreductase
VMMGLRLSEGIGDNDLARIGAGDIATAFNPVRLARLIEGGFLVHDSGRLRALPEGRLRLDAVLAELLT